MKPLVLGLGNEIIGDDAIGLLAVRRLAVESAGIADIAESSISGVTLLDFIVGYEKAIIIDAIKLSHSPPGTIIEFELGDLREIPNPSPHYAGLPEVMALGRRMELDLPDEIRIFAIEAEDLKTVGAKPSELVQNALDELIERVKLCLRSWNGATNFE
jgi:hydrogenase maturation protease